MSQYNLKTLKMNVTQIYITNGSFLMKEPYESTATNTISKTLLWSGLCKIKNIVITDCEDVFNR